MKKFLALFLFIFLISNQAFATEIIEPQKSQNQTQIQELDDFSFLFENFLDISSARNMISFFEENQNLDNFSDTNSLSGNLLTREFAIFMALEKIGISFSPENIEFFLENNNEIFDDIDSESLFSSYIIFAKKSWILQGYEDGTFRPKQLITRDEFEKIIKNIFSKKSEILISYDEMFFANEENLTLNSASENNFENLVDLTEVQNNVKDVIPFEYFKLYDSFNDEEKILAIKNNNRIYFPKIENLDEYILYFDYFGVPFLSKKTDIISEDEISKTMINLVNFYRKNSWLNEVIYNEKLENIAKNYAKQMFEEKYFEHIDKSGKNIGVRALEGDYDYQIVLENLWKWQKSIDEVMNDWKKSSSHNKNILNSKVEEIGIGFYGNYWVQVFGKEFN